MNRNHWYSIALLVAPMAFLLIVHTSFFATVTTNNNKSVRIVCTTSMIGDVVTQIVGDAAQVTTLMGPGVDPHGYRAKESDVRALLSADLVFYNGLHLEGKMAELFELLPKKSAIAIADAITQERLIPAEYDTMYDPHIWHDVSLWILVVDFITPIVIRVIPEQHALIAHRAAVYKKKLEAMHGAVQEAIHHIDPAKRVLVTAHDAFSYFGKAYGLRVIGLQGINTDVEISIHDITQLVDTLISVDMHAIFLETSISPRSMQALHQACKARNWPLLIGPELFSDALGDELTGGQTYTAMIEHNCHAIVSTLLHASIGVSRCP